MRVCSVTGCPVLYEGRQSRCPSHSRTADRARGTAAERGYTSAGHLAFREAVLDRDPVCVLCDKRFSTVADHFPYSRRQLIEAGLNPDDPQYGRGLCTPCHSQETAVHQPGGWNDR
jgi:5-methylcytosine-specific restriction protein A